MKARNIPLEWVSCLYKAVRNGAARANSTHPSQLSDPQMEPSTWVFISGLNTKIKDTWIIPHTHRCCSTLDWRWQNVGLRSFSKDLIHIPVFSLLLPHPPGNRHFLGSGNQTFPITSTALLCNLQGNWVWYRDSRGGQRGWHLSWHRPLGASVGAREQHGKSGLWTWSNPATRFIFQRICVKQFHQF